MLKKSVGGHVKKSII